MENKGEIIIYQTADLQTQIEVKFEEGTIWLNQYQLAELFITDCTSILKHLQNIFSTKELNENETCAKFAQVRKEGKRNVKREILYYNLDAIISVGYRVNSKRGPQFRQWATQKRLQQLSHNIIELEQAVKLIKQSGENEQLRLSEAKGLLQIISSYAHSFALLNQFDSSNLAEDKLNESITYIIEYNDAIAAIEELKKQLIEKEQASALFGNQKDASFAGILNSIVQTFDGNYLYPSIEEQAAIYYTS